MESEGRKIVRKERRNEGNRWKKEKEKNSYIKALKNIFTKKTTIPSNGVINE